MYNAPSLMEKLYLQISSFYYVIRLRRAAGLGLLLFIIFTEGKVSAKQTVKKGVGT